MTVENATRDLQERIFAAVPPVLTNRDRSSGIVEGLAELERSGILRNFSSVSEENQSGAATLSSSTRRLCDLLRLVGRIDLSLARLFEGHVNAVRLIEVHADAPARDRMRRLVADGALLGVWGADGPAPLTWVEAPDGRLRLDGGKRFASGLGLVSHAIVTASAPTNGSSQMILLNVSDKARHDPGGWTASAMQDTCSGGFDATGLTAGTDAIIGKPGDLMIEPHFEGGIWRYCAAHVGGAEGLVDAWIVHLDRLGRLDDAVQRHRLGQALAAASAARATVEAAADAVEGSAGGSSDRIEAAVSVALLARESVERHCTDIINLSERSLGMAAHDLQLPLDGKRRDLSLFLRQASPDAKLDRAVSTIIAGGSIGALR